MAGDLRVQAASMPPAPIPVPTLDRAPLPAQPQPVGLQSSVLPDLPNPRLTVAPGLSRVVLEFFNESGTLTNMIPSQQQLDAYRLAALSGGAESLP